MRKKDFIVSTTNNLEGYSIERYLGVVTDRIVVGAGMFSEFFAAFTDVFGDRSIKFENRIEELHELAMTNLEKKAIALGANSLIGVTMDTDEISGKNMQMFMATVTGTAVVIIKNAESEKLIFEEEYSDTISAKAVENMILNNKYSQKLSDEKLLFNDFIQITGELINHNLLVPIDVILNAISKYKYQDFSQNTIDIIINYLSMFNKSELTEELNKRILESSINNNLFNTVYEQVVEVNYKDISNIIDKIEVSILDKTIFKNLLKYKKNYDYKDIVYIELLNKQLATLLDKNVVEKYKGTLTNGWICLCGNKNADSLKNCKTCGKGKNGFTDEQSSQIDKIIEHLNNIKEILIQNYDNTTKFNEDNSKITNENM